ncbi:MAG: GNAT family N-acetyltransferase [Bryobacterales bacterium]|nr:GNAT family N-acetyltransferase [Bryobacterales bacterium]
MAEIRRLRESDVPQAYELSTIAGWNQTKADWKRLLNLDPDGCFCVEQDGQVVTTTTAVRHGGDLVWIGMVLTRPEYRGRGLARRLMVHALEWLESQDVSRSMLDATEMGQPLYEKLGFVSDYPVERWFRRASDEKPDDSAMGAFDVKDWVKLDSAAFGADRSRLLDLMDGGSGFAIENQGYALGRPGRIASYFGPCVAVDVDVARSLLVKFLAGLRGEAVIWDLIPASPGIVHLARAFGFDPMRHMVRMRRGGEYVPPSPRIVAMAGLEFG